MRRHFRLDSHVAQLMEQAGLDRQDSAATGLFLRDLTYVYTELYNIKYAEAKAREILPVDTRVPTGAESYVWRQYDRFGVAKLGDMSGEDAPNINLSGVEFQQRIYSVTMSYQYTHQDVRAAAMGNLSLDAMNGAIVRRAFENMVEATAVLGDAGATLVDNTGRSGLVGSGAGFSSDPIRMTGFANAPNILNAAVPVASVGYQGLASVSGSTLQTGLNWALPSSPIAAIVADFLAMYQCGFNVSMGVHKPLDLLLPTPIMSRLSTAARSSTFTTDTILSYMKDLLPGLNVIHWPALDFAGLKQDNTTAGPRVMLCERKPENFQLVIPQEFEQFPPQNILYGFKVPCHMRVGGVKMPYPKSVVYLDGTNG
jgi:hypothetical protein